MKRRLWELGKDVLILLLLCSLLLLSAAALPSDTIRENHLLSRLLQPGVLLAEEPVGKLLDACQRLPANRRNIVLAHIRKETDYEL